MQVRNKIGVKSLNLTPTPASENFDFLTPTPPESESESGFGVQCRALVRAHQNVFRHSDHSVTRTSRLYLYFLSEIFHNMVTNNGNPILDVHLMYIPNYGNFNNNIGIKFLDFKFNFILFVI